VFRELEDRFGPAPAAIGNLLDYAVLKGLCEKLGVSSLERRGDQAAVKFHEQTTVRGERVVGLLQRWEGMRLDPSGVLWFPWRREAGGVAEAARQVLLQLQA
jgi:transcription-repair coupling factor (superfamily II helicase)